MFFFLIVSPQIVQVDFDELAAVIEVLASDLKKRSMVFCFMSGRPRSFLKGLIRRKISTLSHAVKGGGEF